MEFELQSINLNGVKAEKIKVECLLSKGMFQFSIVGMASQSIKEAKDRVLSALYANEINLPNYKITINLAPADLPKSGAHLDLPIALALLAAIEIIPKDSLNQCLALGELSLDGMIQPVKGVLAAALLAEENALRLICPYHNKNEAQMIDNKDIIYSHSLNHLLKCLKGEQKFQLENSSTAPHSQPQFETDMSYIKGLLAPRRAAEIAAAGSHHFFLLGAPGSGKSLLASAIPSILPPLSQTERQETCLVYSAAGQLNNDQIFFQRPYIEPHHTASAAAIVGGGRFAKPGSISLAHNGVLFLDELPEFKRDVLESLRQPLETGKILIARAEAFTHYPAKFLLVAAANPCSCGMMFNAKEACNQAPHCSKRYLSRISGPLMDRFSLRVTVPPVEAKDLFTLKGGEASEPIRNRVTKARAKQYSRNGELVQNDTLSSTALDKILSESSSNCQNLMIKAAQNLNLSARGYYRILKTALTIYDLSESDNLHPDHIAEAIAFRSWDIQNSRI